MELDQNFKEFAQSLNANGVHYLVVGGYAVAAHGHPRYTKDLDVWIDITRDNAARVHKALADFGFGQLNLSPADFTAEGQVIQLGYPPHRIDLLTSLKGVSFAECYAARMVVTIDGVPIGFIDLESLKKNKRAAGRLQDLADLDALE